MSNTYPYFLEQVAERVLSLRAEHERCAVIFPNQRPAVFLRRYMSHRIDKPIFAPAILTMEELLNDVAGLIKQDYISQLFQLYDAHREVVPPEKIEPFNQFLGWARTFIADCNDIDNALADPTTFFTHLYEDKRIRNWTPGEENTPLQQSYLAFWKEAELLYKAFTERLDNIGGGYVGFNYKQAITKLESGVDMPFDYVVFAGFNALNTAEERAIDLIIQDGRGEVMWDMDDYYAGDDAEQYKAGNYYRKYKDRWKLFPEVLNANMGYKNTAINIIEAPNNTAQCDIAYRILQERIDRGDIKDPASVAVILCDENLLEPMLLRLPEQIESYNVTMGKALNTFSLYHLFDKLIDVFLEIDKEGYTTESLMNLAATPEMTILDDDETFRSLQGHIIKSNIYRLSHAAAHNAEVSSVWKRVFNTTSKPHDVIELSKYIINRLRAKAEESQDRKMKEILFEYRSLFVQLENSVKGHAGIVDLQALRKLYKTAAMQIKLPFEGEPVSGIQIMGLLESRLLDFDHIILLSANEGILPESKNSNSSIPYIFRQYYHMPVYHERDAIFAYSFYRLLHHVSRMDIIYNGATASIGSSEKSRYVQQLQAEYTRRSTFNINIQEMTYGYEAGKIDHHTYSVKKTPEVIESMVSFFRKKSLSATSIELLVRSPLDFYLRYILGYKKPKELETDFEANTFGSVVHEALKLLYDKHIGVKLTKDILESMEREIDQAIALQVEEIFKNGDTRYGYNHLLMQAARVMIMEVIQLDKKRIEKEEIIVLATELDVKSTFPYSYSGETITIGLKGSIDRVQSCDGVIEIIDYKTGKIDTLKSTDIAVTGENHKKKLLQQLLTYVYMYDRSHEEVSLDNIRPALLGLRSWQQGLSYIDDGSYRVTSESLDHYLAHIKERINELLDPATWLTPEVVQDKTRFSDFLGVWGME